MVRRELRTEGDVIENVIAFQRFTLLFLLLFVQLLAHLQCVLVGQAVPPGRRGFLFGDEELNIHPHRRGQAEQVGIGQAVLRVAGGMQKQIWLEMA